MADEALPTLNKEMMGKDWREPRVKAAFVMAPAWSWIFDATEPLTYRYSHVFHRIDSGQCPRDQE